MSDIFDDLGDLPSSTQRERLDMSRSHSNLPSWEEELGNIRSSLPELESTPPPPPTSKSISSSLPEPVPVISPENTPRTSMPIEFLDLPPTEMELEQIEQITKIKTPYTGGSNIVNIVGLVRELYRLNPKSDLLNENRNLLLSADLESFGKISKMLYRNESKLIWPKPEITDETVIKYEGTNSKREQVWTFKAKSPFFERPTEFATRKMKKIGFEGAVYLEDIDPVVRVVREMETFGNKRVVVVEPAFLHDDAPRLGPLVLPPQQWVEPAKKVKQQKKKQKIVVQEEEEEESEEEEEEEESSEEYSDDEYSEEELKKKKPKKKTRKTAATKPTRIREKREKTAPKKEKVVEQQTKLKKPL